MKIYELLDSKEKWTTGAWARNAEGVHIDARSKDAVCWCLLGAIIYLYPEKATDIFDKIYKEIGVAAICFNDEHTYEEVITLCKKLEI